MDPQPIPITVEFFLDLRPVAPTLHAQLDTLGQELTRWRTLDAIVRDLTVREWGGTLSPAERQRLAANVAEHGAPSLCFKPAEAAPECRVTVTYDPQDLPEPFQALLIEQREAFRLRWDRPFQEGDPLFFDPAALTPAWLEDRRLWEALVAASRRHGLDPVWVAAMLGYPVLPADRAS